MRVAERDIGDGDVAAVRGCGGVKLIFGNGDVLVGEGGPADGAEVIELDDQAAIGGDGVEVGDFDEGAAFAGLRALAVAGVEECDAVFSMAGDGFGGADAGVHAAAEKDDGGWVGGGGWHRKSNYSAWWAITLRTRNGRGFWKSCGHGAQRAVPLYEMTDRDCLKFTPGGASSAPTNVWL